MSVINNHSLGRFGPVSWTITLFWGLAVISMIDEPLVRLRVGGQHSHIRPILVRFVHYYSAFWGPRAIFTIDEPRGVFTCPSSALTVLANSGLFHGLLLTVLGSWSDYLDYQTLGCIYMLVINIGSIGRFWPVSWTITH